MQFIIFFLINIFVSFNSQTMEMLCFQEQGYCLDPVGNDQKNGVLKPFQVEGQKVTILL